MRKKKKGTLKPHQSSIILDLGPILKARNIRFPSAFLTNAGINNRTLTRMMKGEAVQVNFRQLTILCMNLNCTPNDLFVLRDMQLPELHALNALPVAGTDDNLPTVQEWLSGKSVAEIKTLLREK
jgi:DNA-binding Xre family transcriptional regulator